MNEKKKGVNKAIAISVLLGVGLAIPVIGMGSASAASVSAWDKIAACESGDRNVPNSGRWNLSYGDATSTGGLQIQTPTWADYGGTAIAPHAYLATKQQQIMIAEKILAGQGPGAWVCNAIMGYPLSSSGPNGSYLKGGTNPYGSVSVPTIPKPSTPKPSTPTQPRTPSTPVVSSKTYVVKTGDTLTGIAVAQKIEGGWKTLYAANKSVIGSNPNLIFPGQSLRVPMPVIKYTVKSGDTLSGIAASYKLSGGWQKLYETNKSVIGSNPNVILPGQILVVSGGSTSPVTTPSIPVKPKPVTPPANSSGYVSPLAKGTYSLGDGLIIGSGGSMSRTAGGHSGQDMIAPFGTSVRSIAAGVVVHAGYGGGGAAYGNHVIIRHADGKYTLYGHMSSHTVSVGASVRAGQMIGAVGSTGNSSGSHLHFEVRYEATAFTSGTFLSPVSYLASHGVSL